MALIFIMDLGVKYETEESKVKRRVYLVKCTGCGANKEIQAGQWKAGYTEFCLDCSKKKRKGVL